MGPESTVGTRQQRIRSRAERETVREHQRLIGSPTADLRRTLIERFLARNLKGLRGPILEVGSGTGRFTPVLLHTGEPTILLDLSRPMLKAARRHLRRRVGLEQPWGYLEGAAENLAMIRGDSLGAVVLVGFFGMLANDGPLVLRSLSEKLRKGGRVIVEAQGPSNAVQENLSHPEKFQYPIIRRLYREPDKYCMWQVIREGYQPFDPSRLANWEYRFWRPHELEAELVRAGFSIHELMSVGPGLGTQVESLRALHRDSRAWRNLVEMEEELGHWPECLGSGPVYLVSADRKR